MDKMIENRGYILNFDSRAIEEMKKYIQELIEEENFCKCILVMEAVLCKWLRANFYFGLLKHFNIPDKYQQLRWKMLEEIEFRSLIDNNYLIRKIPLDMRAKLHKFRDDRNKLAHFLEDEKHVLTDKEIENLAKEGHKLFLELTEIVWDTCFDNHFYKNDNEKFKASNI